jgi:pantothenate kinase
MEPITTMIASAIALGAAAGLKPIVEQGIKDAYDGLKRLIAERYRDKAEVVDAVEYVSKNPEAEKRRAVLEEALTDAGATKDTTLIEAAKAVHVAVEQHAPDLPQSIGMDIGLLKAAVLEVENVQAAAGGTGVKIDTAEIAGPATFKNIGGGGPHPNG